MFLLGTTHAKPHENHQTCNCEFGMLLQDTRLLEVMQRRKTSTKPEEYSTKPTPQRKKKLK